MRHQLVAQRALVGDFQEVVINLVASRPQQRLQIWGRGQDEGQTLRLFAMHSINDCEPVMQRSYIQIGNEKLKLFSMDEIQRF